MRFGEALEDQRLTALFAPDDQIRTVITADVYGEGEADRMLGRALADKPRERFCAVGAIGHDARRETGVTPHGKAGRAAADAKRAEVGWIRGNRPSTASLRRRD